jgi:hypothetical protein
MDHMAAIGFEGAEGQLHSLFRERLFAHRGGFARTRKKRRIRRARAQCEDAHARSWYSPQSASANDRTKALLAAYTAMKGTG